MKPREDGLAVSDASRGRKGWRVASNGPDKSVVHENWRRAVANLLPALGALAILTAPALDAQITSRTDQILARRTDKQARLWPERTSGIVKRANGYFERGFLESADMKKGANGLQFVLGGMRSGNGTTFGLGYRRIDLFNERLAFRTTVRGTPQQAYMFDLDLESPRLRHRRGDFRFYIKHENSPKMDYYGAGPNSQKSGRTSYRLEDTGVDGSGRYRLWSHLYLGGSGGIEAEGMARAGRALLAGVSGEA